jgi:hypothetical protein
MGLRLLAECHQTLVRGGRRRAERSVPVVGLAVVAIAATSLAPVLTACGAFGSSRGSSAVVTGERSSPDSGSSPDFPGHREPIVNLRLLVPSGWHFRRLSTRCGRAGPGVLVGDLSAKELDRIPHALSGVPFGDCTTAWNVSSLPPSYLLVDLTRLRVPFPVSASRFPLKLAGFRVASIPCHCSFRTGYVVWAGIAYDLRVWIGQRASTANRRLVAELVASVRPRSQ